ncbi:hypothetical protein pb186bvf_002526 [Paramecium bursaria]
MNKRIILEKRESLQRKQRKYINQLSLLEQLRNLVIIKAVNNL